MCILYSAYIMLHCVYTCIFIRTYCTYTQSYMLTSTYNRHTSRHKYIKYAQKENAKTVRISIKMYIAHKHISHLQFAHAYKMCSNVQNAYTIWTWTVRICSCTSTPTNVQFPCAVTLYKQYAFANAYCMHTVLYTTYSYKLYSVHCAVYNNVKEHIHIHCIMYTDFCWWNCANVNRGTLENQFSCKSTYVTTLDTPLRSGCLNPSLFYESLPAKSTSAYLTSKEFTSGQLWIGTRPCSEL